MTILKKWAAGEMVKCFFLPGLLLLVLLTSQISAPGSTLLAPTYTISGRLTDGFGNGLSAATVNLSGTQTGSTTTDSSGNYSFPNLPAGGNFTLSPSSMGPNTLTFSANVTNLSADVTVNLQVLFFVTFQVRVRDNSGNGIPGVGIRVNNGFFAALTNSSGTVNLGVNIPITNNGPPATLKPEKTDYVFTPSSLTLSTQNGNQAVNFTGMSAFEPVVLTSDQVTISTWTVQGRTDVYVRLTFPNAGYRVAAWGQPVRSGNDFAADAVVEKFNGTSVQAVTTTAQIYDLGPLADGDYTFTFKNSGTVVKSQIFTVSSATQPPNPIDDAREFVRWQYRDFLNREADQAGEDFWTDNITKCMDPARRPTGQTVEQCTLRQRETTSGAFFQSPEFQYTGYYVYRMFKGALGRPPKLSEFIPDAQFVGNGIIVNGQLSAARINQNKAALAEQFVDCLDAAKYRCAEFKAIYDGLNNQQYVDKLFQTTGVNASPPDRTALVNGLNGTTETRASVLLKIVDGINVISEGNQQFTTTYGQAFYNNEFNRAFVQLEYFGYMKRDPDEAGYNFWLAKLNQFGGNFVNAEMVLAFLTSPEYRARFGQP
jgi:hypothetical protein